MAHDREDHDEKHVGPAYPARYAKLGRVRFDTPARRAILVVGLAVVVVLILLALLAA